MSKNSLSGALTGHSLTSCIDELSLQDHNDLTDCTQIATKSADMLCSRFTDSSTWLHEYVNTLDFLGWSVFEDAIFTRTRSVISQSVAHFLVQSAEGMRDSRQGNAMIDTLDALKPDKSALFSLDKESLMGEGFQVIPARYDSRGFLEIAVFNLELVVTTRKSGFLFWNWEDQDAQITQRRASLKLDRYKLENKKPLIEKKLREITMKRFELRKPS
ncbi:hypothetical protein D3C81_802130 [compost metagenome]|uniref:hypothetical protein n=1 Tax=unclassified Pseudomonas TaxID=196821 RepID=UPI000BB36499|nr:MULTISPECIES: hypothetical protein [unclassified Pseudomonas]PBJ08761.1 hypothetical protein BSF40_16350 [Pseudomonas sp. ACN5]PMZ78452.1 hypothetical protein C1X65_00215 [Pseudomonas sp. FW305-70]